MERLNSFIGSINGLMAIPNLIALLLLTPVVISETKQYFEGLRK